MNTDPRLRKLSPINVDVGLTAQRLIEQHPAHGTVEAALLDLENAIYPIRVQALARGAADAAALRLLAVKLAAVAEIFAAEWGGEAGAWPPAGGIHYEPPEVAP